MLVPPPVPFALRVLRGNPWQTPPACRTRAADPQKLPAAANLFKCLWLDEWCRTVPQLHALGMLTAIDVA
jgi:hypothetical protein